MKEEPQDKINMAFERMLELVVGQYSDGATNENVMHLTARVYPLVSAIGPLATGTLLAEMLIRYAELKKKESELKEALASIANKNSSVVVAEFGRN